VSKNTTIALSRGSWDYLVITASNELQAEAYRSQIELRCSIGQLTQAREVVVIADLEGRRIGSGGSTIECLRRLVEREREASTSESAEAILRRLRILILHAGGDSRRLPAYSPCGKLFVPLPGEGGSALGLTLFDRLIPNFFALPLGAEGQVVVAVGDALIGFDPVDLNFTGPGIIALGAFTTPEEASRHGVFCPGARGSVRRFLQKPSLPEQAAAGALNRQNQAVLDVGIMSLDSNAAMRLLNVFCETETLAWKTCIRQAMLDDGIDLYREICCALGTEASLAHYLAEVRRSGGKMDEELLIVLFNGLRPIPLGLQILEHCSFLHFGATRQLISNGIALLARDRGNAPEDTTLSINNAIENSAGIQGHDSWIEGCRIAAPLDLSRRNVLTGLDVVTPLSLPDGACVDVSEGADRNGTRVRFVRCYGVDDTFKNAVDQGASFCGMRLSRWMETAGLWYPDLWPESIPSAERTLWNAHMFPAAPLSGGPEPYRRWLWFFSPDDCTDEEREQFLAADRYSAAEIAVLADQSAFHVRRSATRADQIERSLPALFRRASPFSARDLAYALERSPHPARMTGRLLGLAHEHLAPELSSYNANRADFGFARIAHSVGTAVQHTGEKGSAWLAEAEAGFSPELRQWAAEHSLAGSAATEHSSSRLCDLAFENLQESILESSMTATGRPRNSLRPDETIWAGARRASSLPAAGPIRPPTRWSMGATLSTQPSTSTGSLPSIAIAA